jgi:hypothetical protein
MVIGVVFFAVVAGDDPPGAPVGFPGRGHRVLPVVPPVAPRQDAFEVAKDLVVLAVPVWAACTDEP